MASKNAEVASAETSSASASRVLAPVVPMNHSEKPEKFHGMDFKRWQQKMLFYLTTLNLARFLKEEAPVVADESADAQAVSAVDAWKHADFLCRNYVLNGLHDSLYCVYLEHKTSKLLWESLDRKYKTEDAGTKKFVVGRFLDYKMVDSKTVISQVQELQLILHEIAAEGMTLSETFQVAAVIEKLSSGWKDFKNYLKHKRKEMNLEDLVVRLRIEEDNRKSEIKHDVFVSARANVVEHKVYHKRADEGSKNHRHDKGKGKLGVRGGIAKPKFTETCFNCGEVGHKSFKCRQPKQNDETNMMEEVTQDVEDLDLVA